MSAVLTLMVDVDGDDDGDDAFPAMASTETGEWRVLMSAMRILKMMMMMMRLLQAMASMESGARENSICWDGANEAKLSFLSLSCARAYYHFYAQPDYLLYARADYHSQ